MNRIVFKEFMRKEIVQKSVIFARAFGISITNWYGADETDKFPYRIYFCHGRNLVGYIDAEVKDLSDYLYNFSFEFFTPIGIMKGYFDSNNEIFCYDIEEKHNNFDKVDGLFRIESIEKNGVKNYVIGSRTELVSQDKPLLYVKFISVVVMQNLKLGVNNIFVKKYNFGLLLLQILFIIII